MGFSDQSLVETDVKKKKILTLLENKFRLKINFQVNRLSSILKLWPMDHSLWSIGYGAHET